MKIAHDLFAETNPAFGAFAIISFCRRYQLISSKNPVVALVYLALPIAMSKDTSRSFSETNIKTGLLAWLNRYPAVRLDLDTRINASLHVVTASLKLGLMSKALTLDEVGSIGLGQHLPKQASVAKLPDDPRAVIRRADRLGGWMGEAGSAGSVFSAFGVSP